MMFTLPEKSSHELTNISGIMSREKRLKASNIRMTSNQFLTSVLQASKDFKRPLSFQLPFEQFKFCLMSCDGEKTNILIEFL